MTHLQAPLHFQGWPWRSKSGHWPQFLAIPAPKVTGILLPLINLWNHPPYKGLPTLAFWYLLPSKMAHCLSMRCMSRWINLLLFSIAHSWILFCMKLQHTLGMCPRMSLRPGMWPTSHIPFVCCNSWTEKYRKQGKTPGCLLKLLLS